MHRCNCIYYYRRGTTRSLFRVDHAVIISVILVRRPVGGGDRARSHQRDRRARVRRVRLPAHECERNTDLERQSIVVVFIIALLWPVTR